jgi:hypothetical protein
MMVAAPNDPRSMLLQLVKGLRDLHRNLVEIARGEYERETGGAIDAGHLLQLLTKDAQFAWLHELSEFMVTVDEFLDEATVSDQDVQAIVVQARALITPSEDNVSEFTQRYVALLQHHPALTMAHATVRQLLARA